MFLRKTRKIQLDIILMDIPWIDQGNEHIQEERTMKENKREGTFTCGGCLEEWPVDQLHEFDGRNLCSECFREETVVCSVCGERIWTYDLSLIHI